MIRGVSPHVWVCIVAVVVWRTTWPGVKVMAQQQVPVECLSLFLAGHKYFGVDTRKGNEITWKYRENGFYQGFPRPRLKKIHPLVAEMCERGFAFCLEHLTKMAAKVPAFRKSTAGRQFCSMYSEKEASSDIPYYPFDSWLDFFRFRTSASYYMCWYTMNDEQALQHITVGGSRGSACLDRLNDVEEPLQNQRFVKDWRTSNIKYQCALIFFCPDPCHGRKTKGNVPDEGYMTQDDTGNPCRGLKNKRCSWDRQRNRDFDDLQRNRFNITCECDAERKGFAWDSRYHLCVDVDECADVNHKLCTGKHNTRCVNTVGGFECMCRAGFVMKGGRCEEHVKIPSVVPFDTAKAYAKHLERMMEPESSGSYVRRQLEIYLGMSGSVKQAAELRLYMPLYVFVLLSVLF